MPTYDYQCTVCNHIFEHSQSMTDKLLTKCPKCGKKLKRLIGGGAGIIFKGSGFYATDYKKSSASGSSKQAPVCPKAKEGGCSGCNAH